MTTTSFLRTCAGEITIPFEFMNGSYAAVMLSLSTALVDRFAFDVNAEPELFYFVNANVHASSILNIVNEFFIKNNAEKPVEGTFVSGTFGEFTHTINVRREGDEGLIQWACEYTGPDLPATARASFRN